MNPFWLDLGLGIGIAAGSIVVLEGIFRVGLAVARFLAGRRIAAAWKHHQQDIAAERDRGVPGS